MSGLVTFETVSEYSTITLDDGSANVMSAEMLTEINEALDQAEAEAKTVVIAGREGMFSAGFDLATFEEGGDALFEMLLAGAETAERVLSFPRPVVVACTGHAVAMGLFLVLAADKRIGAAGEFTLQANEVEIGLTLPRFAIELCRQRLTPATVSQATVLAEPYSPEEAVPAGIFDTLAPTDAVLSRAQETARSLTRLDMDAHRGTKLRVREEQLVRLREAIETDAAEWEETYS